MAAIMAVAASVHAAPLITNGGFDDGFTSWTTANSGLTEDSTTVFVLSSPGGPTDPIATNGSSEGPASRVLYQDFFVPLAGVSNASFSFDFFSDNAQPLDSADVTNIQGGEFEGPNIFRIDIVDPNEPVFTTPFLFALFVDEGGVVGSDTSLEGQTYGDSEALTLFLNSYAGSTLRLRIGQAESTRPWGTGVDNVSLAADLEAIPEPTSMVLFGLGGIAMIVMASRRKRRTASQV